MKCDEICYPCCDMCVHVVQEKDAVDGKYVNTRNIGCGYHSGAHYQALARGSHYCRDFVCIYADQKEKKNESR